MPFTLALDAAALAASVDVRLGGRSFSIAPLVLRQTSVIGERLPAIMRMINRRRAAFDAIAPDREPNDEERIAAIDAARLTPDELKVSLEVIRAGLSRAYPDVTIDDLLDLPITIPEIMTAVTVALRQTNGLVETKDAAEAAPAGEAQAATGPA